METSPIRILVVDDYEPWRQFVCKTLQANATWQVIGQASNGSDAVRQAEKLHPDLVVLDIGLPTLKGIEAARRIRERTPKSRILFLSENRSWDIAQEALRTGAGGYVIKSDAGQDLLPAVIAVLEGKRFVSSRLADREGNGVPSANAASHHEVGFYSDDRLFIDHLTQFIGSALKGGNAAIAAASESHRAILLPRLQMFGVDRAVEQGRYLALDAADVLSTFMRDGKPDPALFMSAFGNVIATAIKATKVAHPRVAIFGECVNLLWAKVMQRRQFRWRSSATNSLSDMTLIFCAGIS